VVLLKSEELLRLYDAELRRKVEITRMRREELPGVVRYIEAGNQGGFVSWAEMNEANADQVIDEQIAYFKGLVHPQTWANAWRRRDSRQLTPKPCW
jgi:hypothetical protein